MTNKQTVNLVQLLAAKKTEIEVVETKTALKGESVLDLQV